MIHPLLLVGWWNLVLEKEAMLGVAKDDEGLIIVDKETKKGVRIPEEGIVQLTLLVWELCDKLECVDIVEKLVGDAKATPEQKGTLTAFVDQSLEFFQEIGWAAKKEAPVKKGAPSKRPASVSQKE